MDIHSFSVLTKSLFDKDVGYWVVRCHESIVKESYWTIDRVTEMFGKVEGRYPGFLNEHFGHIPNLVDVQLIAQTLDSGFRLLGDETKEVFVYSPNRDNID